MIECLQLLENDEIRPRLLHRQGIKFYEGFSVIIEHEIEQATASVKGEVHPDITVSMVLFHFSIECLLKALISLNNEKPEKTHRLSLLVEKAKKYYSDELNILDNNEIIKILSDDSVRIRYFETFIFQLDAHKLNALLIQCNNIYLSIYEILKKELSHRLPHKT